MTKKKTPELPRQDTLGPGEHGFGEGLLLRVTGGSRMWFTQVFMLQADGTKQKKKVFIGNTQTHTEAEAHEEVTRIRRDLKRGLDPKAELAKRQNKTTSPTFMAFATECMDRWLPELKNEKSAEKWRGSIEKHCKPIASTPIDKVNTAGVLACIEPIWQTSPTVADEVRARIARFIDTAVFAGHREKGQNPAAWEGHLKIHFNGKRKTRGKVRGPQRAIDYTQLPAFIADLRTQKATTARMMEVTILTCVRAGNILNMKVGQLDLDARLWCIPIEEMKVEHSDIKSHDIPLCDRAVELLREQLAELTEINGTLDPETIVWTGQADETYTSAALLALLARMGVDSTTHGMRSCIRTWADDQVFPDEPGVPASMVGSPKYHDDAVELCLAHVTGKNVKRCYRRGNMLLQRTAIMKAWGEFCRPPRASLRAVA
jgi:integrase